MSIETTLVQSLELDASVAALVSDRIYPLRLPQSPTLPALVYSRISSVRAARHGGRATLAQARMQVSCWAETYAEVRQLVDAIRKALDGTKPVDGGSALIANDLDLYDTDTGWFHCPVDFMIWYPED